MRLFLGLIMASCFLSAGDFDQIASALKKNWPDKTNIGVVCNQESSKAKVQSLAAAFGSGGYKVTVFDVKNPTDIGKIISTINGKKPDFIVLIPGDNVAGDGAAAVTFLVQRLSPAHIAIVCTTEAGLKQGAFIAAGPGTGGKVMGNAKTAAVVGLAVPE